MKKTILLPFLMLSLFSVKPALAEDVLAVSVQRLTTDTALKIAQGAMAACREKGIQIGVTIVNREGKTQVMLRDTIAAPITSEISLGKAYAAAMFNVSTKDLASRADTPIGRVPGLVMATGGLTIQGGGALLGAIGVSGAPSGDTDEECAQAGIDLVQDDLDFM